MSLHQDLLKAAQTSNSHVLYLGKLNLIQETQKIENFNFTKTRDPTVIVAPIILLVMAGIIIFHKVKISHQISSKVYRCQKCRFFAKNNYLKCAVNPSVAFTEEAKYCCDYQPQEKRIFFVSLNRGNKHDF
ncbi:MAG: hypothetical protein KME32_05300 [Mojavia pulchra JT2-VF2]|jgi:hypothetical protein|uniref:Uncharacterized protein n=1 Tax=Mojavia pulchra JT2-VF2 TaxID=287848 RepID=A0A951PWW0_9NOST|nr:hypothetical protein [Mojavia pulchra JT2-VF2]